MKKNKLKTVFTALIAFALATGGSVASVHAYNRQTNKEKSVRVDVLPVTLALGEKVVFDIRMNTHSVGLDNDIVSGSVLKDDKGIAYNAIKWNGTPGGGHHRKGTLEFPALKGNPKSVTLIIKGVSNVPERVYKWTLE
ncbi:MAG: hypothetical protein GXP56_08195 [Deltaproteobacteria bacterium]|nr:hypothetical protein [Deltaproteobacteria bacterium]